MDITYKRFKELLEKYGPLGLVWRILNKPFIIFTIKWRKTFRNYNYVYRWDSNGPRVPIPDGFTMQHFERVDDIPDPLLKQLNDAFGEDTTLTNRIGVKHCGCVLCVGFIYGDPVCFQLIRYASKIPYWFIKLEPDDVVLIRGFVIPEYRGRKLHSCIHQAIASLFNLDKMKIYTDVSIHNDKSLRSIENTGWILLCKKKAIVERWPEKL